MKAIQAENAMSEPEPKNFIHFPWKAYETDPNWSPPQFWKRKKLIFRDVKGR